MKKLFLFIVGVTICLVSCKTISEEEQKKLDFENKVVDFVKSNLKCPSTMQVVSFDSTINVSIETRDTSYYVRKVYGKSSETIGEDGNYTRFWYNIYAMDVDSMRVKIITYPRCISCKVVYDAQNSFGAMVRESAEIMVQGSTMRTLDDFVQYYINSPKYIQTCIKGTKLENLDVYAGYNNHWEKKSDIYKK